MKGLPPPSARLLCEFAALLGIAGLLTLGGCATPPKPPPTANEALPVPLRASQDEVLQEVMTTHGDETYICRRTPLAPGAPGAPSVARAVASPTSSGLRSDPTQLLWAPFGSEATLVDASGESVGTVAPGHYFLSYDGSYVKATTTAESQVGANVLTWARYTASYDAGPRPGTGRFSNVSSIQRIDTSGGLPPQAGCELEGSRLLVPYGATYMFYRAKGVAPIASSTALSKPSSGLN